MLAMLDEKEILLSYIESEIYEAEQAAKEAAEQEAKKAAEQAVKETAKETVVQLLKSGKLSVEEITQYFPSLSAEDVEELQKELL